MEISFCLFFFNIAHWDKEKGSLSGNRVVTLHYYVRLCFLLDSSSFSVGQVIGHSFANTKKIFYLIDFLDRY